MMDPSEADTDCHPELQCLSDGTCAANPDVDCPLAC